jgi:hypothetical protein
MARPRLVSLEDGEALHNVLPKELGQCHQEGDDNGDTGQQRDSATVNALR